MAKNPDRPPPLVADIEPLLVPVPILTGPDLDRLEAALRELERVTGKVNAEIREIRRLSAEARERFGLPQEAEPMPLLRVVGDGEGER
jgi:hypothetical protein